MVEMTVVNGIR